MSNQTPKSAYDEIGGMIFFPRMLSKIRLNASGALRDDFLRNLGTGMDGRCVDFLRVGYTDLKGRVLAGGPDEEILEWCYQTGRRLNENDLLIWNHFIRTLGRDDHATERLNEVKAESGLAHRDDIQTLADYFEVDEGRRP
ncbi:MAG: DUF5069 domain-containing protein [Gemmatimonadaceae bacterium]|nr:DUF5069 domain-containing protein [Gemmatimonadaceae bacterium]